MRPTLEADLAEDKNAARAALIDDGTPDFLRGHWPGLHFTLYGDGDGEAPARLWLVLEQSGFTVCLVDGSGHCLTLTNDPELAIGAVLVGSGEE